MPGLAERAGPFATVLSVIVYCVPSCAVMVSGLAAVASCAPKVRVSRRCTACVPTYPIPKTQLRPSERCTVRFHCCVLGATNFLGTTSPNKPCEGITPGPVPLHAYVGELVVFPPG